jgi:hypothetical protein
MKNPVWLVCTVCLLLSFVACTKVSAPDATTAVTKPVPSANITTTATGLIFGMKGVALKLPQADFTEMKKAGISILATEWGMEADLADARAFLDQAQKAGLNVVMDGGFSYTAWGFTNDDWDRLPRGKLPVWQKQRVQNWISALKDHPAIYAWDISNEFGENLPDGAGISGSNWPKGMITTDQLKTARADVLAVDNSRPIHARMYGWDIGKMPAHVKALLDNKIADVISLNLYSNYLDNNRLQWPTVIQDAAAYYVENIKKNSPDIIVWLSIGAFEYTKMFERPTPSALSRDLKYAGQIKELDGITFFCWGPVSQWDEKGNWYLPQSGADLWQIIKQFIALR